MSRDAGPGARTASAGRVVFLPSRHGTPRGSSWRARLRALLRHRLLHFALAGAAIFALAPRPQTGRDIALDGATLNALEQAEAQRLGTPVLSTEQRAAVAERFLEDEILYREALRLGFDRNDAVVRQRLVQKVLFLAEDLAGVSRPATADELRAFYDATRGQWTQPATVSLLHVYAGTARRDWLAGQRAAVEAAEHAAPGEPPAVGDPFPLSRRVESTRDGLAADYGDDFAAAAFGAPVGSWTGPVPSRHGWHLVKILARTAEGPAPFEAVEGKLRLLYLVARKKQATADYLREAATRYRLTVDGRPVALEAGGRVAPARSDGVD